MRTVIVLYVISTLCAAFTAVLASFAFPITLTLADPSEAEAIPSDIGEVLMTLLNNMVANPVDALVNANYLGILVWAIVLGIAMRYTSEATRDFFSNISRNFRHCSLGNRMRALLVFLALSTLQYPKMAQKSLSNMANSLPYS